MKIAFTTSGETLDSALDDRFGRAQKFVYDLDRDYYEVIDNRKSRSCGISLRRAW